MKPKRQAEVAKLEAGLESLLSHATLSGENETAKQRQGMYERKPRRAWSVSDTSPPQDSGSESAPLLSSGTHMSFSPMIFHDSDTSDLDFSPIADSPRYGSAATSNFNSMAILPRRVPLLAHDSPLITSHQTNISPPPPYSREGYYQIHNSLSDLVIDDSICKDGGTRPIIKEVGRGFLPGPLPLIQDPPPITSKSTKRTQSSLVTIFSIWNTILGSSLLTMPWGIAMAGLIPGIGLMLAMGGLCLYTAYRLLQVHKYHGAGDNGEVTALSRTLLGSWAEYIAKTFSITVMLGANIAYWVLMSNFLYYSVNFLYDIIAGLPIHPPFTNESHATEVLCPKQGLYNDSNLHDHSYDNMGPLWDLYKTVPIVLAILIFPLLNFSSATFFMKFNSLGTVSILYLIVFVIVKSTSWGINMDNKAWESSWELRPTFPALSGMLALSFFIHNIIITIMQNNENQKNNGRDLTIAYILVICTYILIGIMFYVCFPLAKSCIEDNLLNNFQKWDGLTIGARVVLFFQLLTVYPLIAYMLRIQILSAIFKTSNCTKSYVLIVNIVTVLICVLFAIFMPRVGTIIRYTGAMSGFIYVFTLPSLLHLMSMYKQGKMTMISAILHLTIPIIGVSNLAAQFLISED
ncbi:sodium-coupled neutral amino acid transporter 9-like [Neodiprion virginianus]|uniref:sodium-coupled neutral amino acid transporter 9-like n=1 Tax=Neodiprion virginianus TaxID=2961670 RepID=UPI001EE6FAC3|nr:sodium-coupled neutral amino acid transporter 9-like [Neodiprion virginianus]XP_046629961.1 sodium-coupled neutral amino acid transporter 9-like [Neodiprion virginianus]